MTISIPETSKIALGSCQRLTAFFCWPRMYQRPDLHAAFLLILMGYQDILLRTKVVALMHSPRSLEQKWKGW